MTGDGRSRPAVAQTALGAVVIVTLLVAVLLTGFAGGGAAADNPGLLDFEPSGIEATPGETVTVDVTLAAMGGYDDDGVRSFRYTVAYDNALLTATDVDVGPWMYQENETEVDHETTIDEGDSVGRITVEQSREPPAGGVGDIGDTPTATITFAVEEEAAPSDAVVQFEDAEAELLEFPLPVLTSRELVVAIDGGGERRAPLDTSDTDDDDPGVTLADDPDSPAGTGSDGMGWRVTALVVAGALTLFGGVALAVRRGTS